MNCRAIIAPVVFSRPPYGVFLLSCSSAILAHFPSYISRIKLLSVYLNAKIKYASPARSSKNSKKFFPQPNLSSSMFLQQASIISQVFSFCIIAFETREEVPNLLAISRNFRYSLFLNNLSTAPSWISNGYSMSWVFPYNGLSFGFDNGNLSKTFCKSLSLSCSNAALRSCSFSDISFVCKHPTSSEQPNVTTTPINFMFILFLSFGHTMSNS